MKGAAAKHAEGGGGGGGGGDNPCLDLDLPPELESEEVARVVRRRLETVLSLRDNNAGDTDNAGDLIDNSAANNKPPLILRRYDRISSDLIRSLIDDGDEPSSSPRAAAAAEDDDIDTANFLAMNDNDEKKIWCSKPPLNALIGTLQKWTLLLPDAGSNIPPLVLRDYENFQVPGVVEILPDWAIAAPAAARAANDNDSNDDEDGKNNQRILILETFRSLCTIIAENGGTAANAVADVNVDDAVDSLFELIGGKPGILFLLGHRSTVGSTDNLCPSLRCLVSSFREPHSSNCRLTVGARALTKHCHRSGAFWPDSVKGNDLAKNGLALETLLKILSDAAWVNCHVVPMGQDQQQLPVVEIRHHEGYGARWSVADGGTTVVFRGFLEPVSPFYGDEKGGET